MADTDTRASENGDDEGGYKPAAGERKPLSDADLGQRAYSPVCTFCAHWEAGDGRHCAGAYPRGGPMIPSEIWDGKNTHMGPYPSAARPTDNGVHFALHPDVSVEALKEANPKLYADYTAREQREGSSEGK